MAGRGENNGEVGGLTVPEVFHFRRLRGMREQQTPGRAGAATRAMFGARIFGAPGLLPGV